MKRYERVTRRGIRPACGRGTWLWAAAFSLVLAGCEDEIVDVELPKDAAADTAKEGGSQGTDAGSSDSTAPEDAAEETTPEDGAME